MQFLEKSFLNGAGELPLVLMRVILKPIACRTHFGRLGSILLLGGMHLAIGCVGTVDYAARDAHRDIDSVAPTISGGTPSGNLPAGTTETTLSVLTSEPATCKWDNMDVGTFDDMSNTFDTEGGQTHQTQQSGLVDGQDYTYYVRCRDGTGNTSATSYLITFRVAASAVTILWNDSIQQSSASPWGFNGAGVEYPIGNGVVANDANGANLSRVTDPAGGGGWAVRHFGRFDNSGGSRAQLGLYSFANEALNTQAKSAEGVWVAQEWYFPQTLRVGGGSGWISLLDWHSTAAGANRWDTQPGLMLAQDGSMRVQFWFRNGNVTSAYSMVSLPVGEWVDVEMHYTWSAQPTTISIWINGELAIEQSGVVTKNASHDTVEMYSKLYGSTYENNGDAWEPTPTIRYTRNFRIAGERIWR